MVGALGGACLLGLLVSAVVWHRVSEATFGLLGLVAAAPFTLLPLYFTVKFLRRGRDSDGRGFEDGDGGN